MIPCRLGVFLLLRVVKLARSTPALAVLLEISFHGYCVVAPWARTEEAALIATRAHVTRRGLTTLAISDVHEDILRLRRPLEAL